ncbi:hypothetical protein [Streptomyces collinus]|uniref:hypothetical protein n=1 Tax=Streptomyces collinus TaxID=42684 RepID=UPI002942D744|nr:hypothetical protein [Streptomyces collinus]
MNTRLTGAALCAAVLLALVGCSSNSDDDAKPSTPATTASSAPAAPTTTAPAPDAVDLERVAGTYADLYFAGEGKGAYAFLSKRCRAQVDPGVYADTVKHAARDYGPDHPATDVHATVSGDKGRVSYRVKGLPKFDQQAQPWTREGSAWKYDAC